MEQAENCEEEELYVRQSRFTRLCHAKSIPMFPVEIELLKNDPDIFLLMTLVRGAPDTSVVDWLAKRMGIALEELDQKLTRAGKLGVLVKSRRGEDSWVPVSPDKLRGMRVVEDTEWFDNGEPLPGGAP